MNERIKKVRKALGLTQKEFAERIGMKQNTIALIEKGRNTSDQTIFSICREYNVNEKWLRTGEGEMFKAPANSPLDALAEEYHLTPATRMLIEKYINLKPELRKMVIAFALDLAASLPPEVVSQELPTSSPEKALHELSIDEKVDLYRKELELEEGAAAKSEASQPGA